VGRQPRNADLHDTKGDERDEYLRHCLQEGGVEDWEPPSEDLRENHPGARPRKGTRQGPDYGVAEASVISRNEDNEIRCRNRVEPRETSRPRGREVISLVVKV
jgi:hypothetical protein